MTLKFSANDLRLKPGETPTPERLMELFEGIQTNFEQLGGLFPLQGTSVGKLTDTRLSKPVIVGQISSAGAVVVGSGFTSEKTATGQYKVTLSTELATAGIMVVTAVIGSAAPLVLVTSSSKKVFEVNTRATLAELKDGGFTFHVKAS